MNAQINQTEKSEGKDFCTQSFEVSGRIITNSYKCDQKPFTPADLWNIQKQSKK